MLTKAEEALDKLHAVVYNGGMGRKCRHFGCRYQAKVKVRQLNGFIGYCCRRHIEGDEVIGDAS